MQTVEDRLQVLCLLLVHLFLREREILNSYTYVSVHGSGMILY
jgi:hypothetical protein